MRIINIFLSLFITVSVFAGNNDITMIYYEQSWLDSEGTIALKNNTTKEVQKVVFEITYLDMDDNELDYEVFSERITIAPQKTKKLNIPAYERNRNYHYYKTKDSFGHPKFKIKYRLKDYSVNTTIENCDSPKILSEDYTDNIEYYYRYIIVGIILLFFVLGITIGSYVLVAVMAVRRRRNAALWVLLSFIASPYLIILILLCIGRENNNE